MYHSLAEQNKQSGFTLIELMVVMAIIAILATAGLSAYTGYIKKARDATRIADISAINKIILGSLSVTGMPPQTTLEVYNLVRDANNGVVLMDPLASNNGITSKYVCLGGTSARSATCPGKLECAYTYRVCDGGMGYAIGARFESTTNTQLYSGDNIPTADHVWWHTDSIFEVGSCIVSCHYNGTKPGCPSVSWTNVLPTRISSSSSSYVQICGGE